jgi:stage II sporulation protein AA (anti-sigma F factor antagonist)
VALTVSVERHGTEAAVVSAGGELDISTGTLLYLQLSIQLAEGRRHLVLDLAEVPFMDSSGLNTIIRANNETKAAGGRLVLAEPTSSVRRVLELTGMSLSLPVFATVEEALAEGTPQQLTR